MCMIDRGIQVIVWQYSQWIWVLFRVSFRWLRQHVYLWIDLCLQTSNSTSALLMKRVRSNSLNWVVFALFSEKFVVEGGQKLTKTKAGMYKHLKDTGTQTHSHRRTTPKTQTHTQSHNTQRHTQTHDIQRDMHRHTTHRLTTQRDIHRHTTHRHTRHTEAHTQSHDTHRDTQTHRRHTQTYATHGDVQRHTETHSHTRRMQRHTQSHTTSTHTVVLGGTTVEALCSFAANESPGHALQKLAMWSGII
jgi:hypothetical protein